MVRQTRVLATSIGLFVLAISGHAAAHPGDDPMPEDAIEEVESDWDEDTDENPLLDRDSKEYAFAECVSERDQSLLHAMQNAKTEEEFSDALRRAADLCDLTDPDTYSFGKFFAAVASFIGLPDYSDVLDENDEDSD